MGVLAGILGVSDLNTRLIAMDTEEIYSAVARVSAEYQKQRDEAFRYFVQGTTEKVKFTYKRPGGDLMQPLDRFGRPAEQRPTGSWEVALPVETFGTGLGWDKETYAYMTVEDLDNTFESATISNARTHKFFILEALLDKTNWTYKDARHGDLTIRRLANTDGTTYPPFFPTETEADDQHYIVSGYAAASISDANNPLDLIKTELKEHTTSTPRIIVHINSAQRTKIKALTEFVDAPVSGITPGANTAIATPYGDVTIPGEFLGVDGATGVYVYEWDQVPANYMLGRLLDLPAPLMRRDHIPVELKGFKLEAEEETAPLNKRTWIDRFGYGVAERLSAVALELTTDGSYDTPSGY